MHLILRVVILIIAAIVLVACGGGGGSSSGGSGGTPAPVVTDTLRLSTGAITASATQFEDVPGDVSVRATVTGNNTAGIAFGTLPGVDALPSWLTVELGTFSGNSIDAVFKFVRSDLPAGTYETTVRAASFDANENALDTADILITYELAEGIPLSVSPESVDVVMHYASDPISQVMSITAGNYLWNAFSSEANLDIDEGTGSQDVTLSILPAMEAQVDENGLFQGVVDVIQNSTSNNALFFINYTMFPTLEYIGNDIFLNGVSGNSDSRAFGINLRGEELNWSVSADEPWVSFSATSGVISTADDVIDSPDGDDFSVTIDSSTLDEGRHEAIMTITAEADQTVGVLIVVEVASQKLDVSKRGVALSQTATTNKLQSIIDVSTNADRMANWTASSNAAWLSVTSSGTVADDLTITADPTLLMDETFSEAIITVVSPDSEISETETIQVGFWKSAQTASDMPARVGGMFPEDLIVTDPIRPLAYVHSGEREINIVNIYSGAVEKTLTPSSQVFNFDVSDDGAFLYLVRSGEGEGFIDLVDLNTQEISTTWTYAAEGLFPRESQDIGFVRITNEPYLILSRGVIFEALTGEIVTLDAGIFPVRLDLSSSIFCNQGDDVSDFNSEFSCHEFVSAGFAGARLTSVLKSEGSIVTGRSVVSQDGSRVFGVANRTLALLNTADLSEIETVETPPEDFVEDVFLDDRGNLYVTYRNDGFIPTEPTEDPIDESRFIRVYDEDLVFIRNVDYPSNGDGFVPILSDAALSGDDQRVVYLTDGEFLEVNVFSVNE